MGESKGYQWVYVNGQVQVSPSHSHQELLDHSQISPDHHGPIAMGHVEVTDGKAGWSVVGNLSLGHLKKVLTEAGDQIGWRFGGLIDHIDQVPVDDQFAPKRGSYPGGGNMNDMLKSEHPLGEDLEIGNLGDNAGQGVKHQDPDDPGPGPWTSRDGKVFHSWGDYLVHAQHLNQKTDQFAEDGKFPQAPDMDIPIPGNWHPRFPFTFPISKIAKDPKDMLESPVPFIYDVQDDKIVVGHPGSLHSAIPGKFTPGGIVEGTYEPGGKVVIRSMTTMPYSSRHVLDLWSWSYPQMEVTSLELEDANGNTTKLASDILSSMDLSQKISMALAADPAADRAALALQEQGGDILVVGGAIRDILSNRIPNDFDLMVSGLNPEKVSATLSALDGRVDLTGKSFGVFRYRDPEGYEVEVALPRKEASTGATQKDFDVELGVTVEEDLGRRDFTVNAMAFRLETNELIDPHGGREDVKSGILAPVFAQTFQEDPTRLLRALTACARFDLTPSEDLVFQMGRDASRLQNEPKERIQKELDKIFEAEDPTRAMRLAQKTGLLQEIFPVLHDAAWNFDQRNKWHAHKLGDHLLNVLAGVVDLSPDPDLRLAAFLHDIGKPNSAWESPDGQMHYYRHVSSEGSKGHDHWSLGAKMARQLLEELKYPTARINRITHLVERHMFDLPKTQKSARKLIARVGDENLDDLLILRHADQYGKGNEKWSFDNPIDKAKALIQEVREAKQPIKISDLALNGNDLKDLGFQGPRIGETLRHLTSVVIDTPEKNKNQVLREVALEWGF